MFMLWQLVGMGWVGATVEGGGTMGVGAGGTELLDTALYWIVKVV